MHRAVIRLSAFAVLITITPRLSGQELVRLSLDELLARWEQAGAALTTVDVSFERVDGSPLLVGPRRWTGRLVLKRPHLALVEFREGDNTRPAQVIAWGDREVRQVSGHMRQVYVFRRPKPGASSSRGVLAGVFTFQDRARTPHTPSLPYLFGIDAEELRERYEIEIVGERADAYVVSLEPRPGGTRQEAFSRCLVLLDRRDFRPQAMRWEMGGSTTWTFLLRNARYNEPIEDAIFEPGVPEGWEVLRYDEPPASGRTNSGTP